jgi:mRNA interferase MazF
MTRGKVVLVPFPFDDFSGAKVRPAVCLTDPIGTHRHVVLAFISSRVPADLLETDFILDSTQADFAATGLRVSSALHKRIIFRAGSLPNARSGCHQLKEEVKKAN